MLRVQRGALYRGERVLVSRAILTLAAWLLGWALLTAAAARSVTWALPGFPIWIVPVASGGALLAYEAVAARNLRRERTAADGTETK